MGKKKNKPDRSTTVGANAKDKEPKSLKSYSTVQPGWASASAKEVKPEDLIKKVSLPPPKEAAILGLIQDYQKTQKNEGTASLRLTAKKLTDLYTCLQHAGFKSGQVEQAMSNVVHYGGDLIDALDWLCLNLANDQLPTGFSQTLLEEETKRSRQRETFADSQAAEAEAKRKREEERRQQLLEEQEFQAAAAACSKPGGATGDSSMKNWILQYAQDGSDDDKEVDDWEKLGDVEDDRSDRYLKLAAKLMDAKAAAAEAKQEGNKSEHKQLSKEVRELTRKMEDIEVQPGFDPQMKLKFAENEKEQKSHEPSKSHDKKSQDVAEPEEVEEGGLDLFAQAEAMAEEEAAKPKPKPESPKKANKKAPLDKRNFEYTRQQWTGKSPKQFLIDWCRKHLPGSPPPKYFKVDMGRNLWKSRCKIEKKKEDNLEVTPEIVTENVKDAEHLASVLALYHLCKGQKIYQLLPPPYRDVWLEWQDAEERAKQETQTEENKPRDQFVAKLMKKLKSEVAKETAKVTKVKVAKEEDTWESLASDEDEEDSSPSNGSVRKIPPFNFRRHSDLFMERSSSTSYQKMFAGRRQLPVYPFREEILKVIAHESVVVIAGETGSGKSTQIPQYILEDYLTSSRGGRACNIVCTEPRRISAMSLANRVCQELGESGPGKPDSYCGYQIRFEAKKCDTTRLLYCTTGVLLRKLQLDPVMSDVTHVIVDEVHERSVDSDFLLILLRQILRKRTDLRVILMSATLDADKFSSYFSRCKTFNIPGRTFPVEVMHVEDVVEMTNFVMESDSPYALREDQLVKEKQSQVSITVKGGDSRSQNLTWTEEDVGDIDLTNLNADQYSHKTRNTVSRMHPDRINMDLIVELLQYLEGSPQFQATQGAVLVFMPGLAHIQELHEMLTTDKSFTDKRKYKIIALHSILSSQDQSAAFDIAPPGVRKIVIATNIAETGITIPDVVFVIDTGKAKENRYIESSQMSTLEEVYISKAAAKQRAGRAGRVQAGFCFRLYTKHKFDHLRAFSIPEILRVPLEELCLHIMKSGRGKPAEFLSQALDAPLPQSVARAMAILREVGACDLEESILTPLGQHLATLPVNVRIGKMMIFGAIFGCLDAVSVISAAMTDKSPFVVPLGERSRLDVAKQSLAMANSDQMTLYKAYLGWQAAKRKGRSQEMSYCKQFCLSRNTMLDIENVAKDLVKLIHSIGFETPISKISETIPTKDISVIKAVLTAGLYPHVGHVTFSEKVDAMANPERQACLVETTQGTCKMHPSSVNRFLEANGYVVYHEKVLRSQVYLMDTTLISAYALLLFGGSIAVQHQHQQVSVDDWIKFKAFARTGVIFKELRVLLEDLLRRKLEDPKLKVNDDPVVQILLDLIMSER